MATRPVRVLLLYFQGKCRRVNIQGQRVNGKLRTFVISTDGYWLDLHTLHCVYSYEMEILLVVAYFSNTSLLLVDPIHFDTRWYAT